MAALIAWVVAHKAMEASVLFLVSEVLGFTQKGGLLAWIAGWAKDNASIQSK